MDRVADILAFGDVWIVVGLVSAVMFLATLAALPWFVARLPVDYFVGPRQPSVPESRHPVLAFVRRLARNTVGIVLVVAGLAMLVLPGQGIVTLLVGVALVDFPGKRRLEQRLLRQRHVRKSLQWLRQRAGRDPLEFEEPNRSRAHLTTSARAEPELGSVSEASSAHAARETERLPSETSSDDDAAPSDRTAPT